MNGLNIIKEFLTLEEESEILSNIDKKKAVKKFDRNSIQRFGSDKPYKSDMVSNVIPEFLVNVGKKLVERKIVQNQPQSVTINQYLKGQAIASHIDSAQSGKVITILSLLSDAIMVFTLNKERVSIEVPRRSILTMSGESREKWKHAIEPVKSERYSIVFRCTD